MASIFSTQNLHTFLRRKNLRPPSRPPPPPGPRRGPAPGLGPALAVRASPPTAGVLASAATGAVVCSVFLSSAISLLRKLILRMPHPLRPSLAQRVGRYALTAAGASPAAGSAGCAAWAGWAERF